MLVDIEIAKKCVLTHNDGRREIFDPGRHSVPQEVADHWWIQSHLRDAAPAVPKIGSVEYALMAKAAADKAVEDARRLADQAARLRADAEEAAKSLLNASDAADPAAQPSDDSQIDPPKRGPGRPPKEPYPVYTGE